MVEFFSADIEFKVWKLLMKSREPDPSHLEVSQLESRGALRDGVGGLSEGPAGLLLSLSSDHLEWMILRTSRLSLSPTLARASLAASASAAMALWSWTGRRASLLDEWELFSGQERNVYISTLSTLMPQDTVASSRTTEIEIFSNISKYFQICLHRARDALPVAEDLVEVLGAEDVPEGGLGQQPRAGVSVLHVSHADRGVTDPVVHHRVHRHRDAVLG